MDQIGSGMADAGVPLVEVPDAGGFVDEAAAYATSWEAEQGATGEQQW